MSTSNEGSIKAVSGPDVIVLVAGREVRIPKERLFHKGRTVKAPCIGKKVYVAQDYSSCDMEPSFYYRQSVQALPAIPVSLRSLLSECQTCAVFQTWDPIRWLGYLVFHLLKTSEEVRNYMYNHLQKLCTSAESMSCLQAFQEKEHNFTADDLFVDGNWDQVKNAYAALVNVVMKRMEKPRSTESDCSLVFNIHLQVYRDTQRPTKFASEEAISIKAKAIELSGTLKIVLLPTIPVHQSVLESARFFHIEPTDPNCDQEVLEHNLKTQIHGQEELLGKMALLSAQMTEAVANLPTTSLLTQSNPTHPIRSFLTTICEQKIQEQISHSQDGNRVIATLQATDSKLHCIECNDIKILTFDCEHSYCENCLRTYMMSLFEKQEGLFLDESIRCQRCNCTASAEESSFLNLGIKCSACSATKGLAKCGKGYHCKAHMVSKIRKGHCDSCKKTYKSEEVEKAKLTEYVCMICHESGVLQYMGDDLRCDCVYHDFHKASGQVIGVCINCHGLAIR